MPEYRKPAPTPPTEEEREAQLARRGAYDLLGKGAHADLTIGWLEWMEKVPATQREVIACRLEDADFTSPADVNAIVRFIMAETVRGNLSPTIGEELRKWVGIVVGFVVAKGQADAGKASANSLSELIQTVREQRRALPTYGVADVVPPQRHVLEVVLDGNEEDAP